MPLVYYYGARYYDPRVSLWLSVDPLVEQTMTPYQYTYQNPIRYIDPTGMAGEAVDTKYKNKNTGEEVEINDGKDETVEVSDRNFANAKAYASQLKSETFYFDDSYDDIIDKYESFYYETRYGSRSERLQDIDYWADLGPRFNRSSVIGGAGGLEFIAGGASKAVVKGVSQIWKSTSKLSSVKNAFGHWKKHRAEFPEFLNAKQYVEGAKRFMHNSPTGTLMKTRANGDVLKYHPGTNTFGVMDALGVPRTMFRPTDGMKYWLGQ